MGKNIKVFIAGMLLLCLFVTMLPMTPVYADDVSATKDGFQYQKDWTDSKAVLITGYEGEGGKVTIPAKIGGKRVSRVGGFKDDDTITEIIVSEGIKSIENETFVNCPNLTKVTLPSTVESAYACFSFCGSLTEFVVAKKNKSFYTVDGVLMKKFANGVMLSSYPGGKEGEYTIPKAVTSIEEQSFYGAAKITKVTIPSTCKSIGPNAFDSCAMLSTVIIGKNGVTSLGWKQFAHCPALTDVSIPSTLLFISEGAFMGSTELKTLKIDAENNLIKVQNGMIISKKANNMGVNLYELLPSVKLNNGVFTVPKDVYNIQAGAFGEIEGLDTIDFSKCKLTSFESYLFEGFQGTSVIVKKGSELAKSLANTDAIYSDDSVVEVKYVK